MNRLTTATALLLALQACSHSDDMDTNAFLDTGMQTAPIDAGDEEGINPFVDAEEEAVSTFSLDVDSASYTQMRRALSEGRLPEEEGVRVEEYLNYFQYDQPFPTEEALSVSLESGPSPFGEAYNLLKIGVQAKQIPVEERDPANLVFLIDVSGSMQGENGIGLIKYTLGTLLNRLEPTDTLSIVTYAGFEEVLLEPTPVEQKSSILDAIDGLTAGGGTNGEGGIRAAYDLASEAYDPEGVNRVILCTDGDFNVGLTGDGLVEYVAERSDEGIFLTVLGFRSSGSNDPFLERLTNNGDGNYAFIDSQNEALRVVGDNMVSTLQTVAKDAKIQVEFNTDVVEQYRLIGYENRMLENEDFVDDTVDAGDLGAGHSVVALYEYSTVEEAPSEAEIAEVRLRFKNAGFPDSVLSTYSISADEVGEELATMSEDYRFAAAIAEYGEILRASPHSEGEDFAQVLSLLEGAADEAKPVEVEVLELVESAQDLMIP